MHPDVTLTHDPKHDFITLVPVTPEGKRWLETYPPFDGESLTLTLEYLPSLRQDAYSEKILMEEKGREPVALSLVA